MSIALTLLAAIALLIVFGALQRVLDRMGLTDRQALLMAAAIFIGGWLPDLLLGPITLNIGGALIPFLVCGYLFFFKADSASERIRTLVSTVITAGVIYAISVFFPANPETMPFDPMVLYGVAGGVIAWILGRSRRCAFVSGILGVLLADIAVGIINWSQGINQSLHLGSAGAQDAVVLSGIIAVLLCELGGEIMERLSTGSAAGPNEDGAIEGGRRV